MFVIPEQTNLEQPVAIFQRVRLMPEHADIREYEPKVAFLFRAVDRVRHGKQVLGECCMPSVQGALRPLFDWMLEGLLRYWPDYLIILDQDWWAQASSRDREIVVFH